MLALITTLMAAAPSPHAEQMAQFGNVDAPLLPRLPFLPLPPIAASDTQATVYGYHPYWGDDPTGLNFEDLTHLAIFAVELNSDGSLASKSRWTNVAGSVVPLAHAHGVKVHLCVISFEDDVHAAFLPSASRRAAAIAELKQLVDDYGADGVNVDIEGLDADLRDDMVSFLQELDAAVGDVVVATPAIDWSDAFDEAAMSQLSGGMFIMGYGYHWTGGDPGPNDPLYGGDPWSSYSLEKTVQSYLSAGADPTKIIMGLPLYGQEWEMRSPGEVPGESTGDAWSVVMDRAIAIAEDEGRLFDTVTRSPYVIRADSQLWYPDNASVEERIQWAVHDATLQGVGFWALTYEGNDPDFWPMVRDQTALTPAGGDDSGPKDSGPADDSDPPSGELPVARAGQPIAASVGDTVFLNGSGSEDPNGYPLRYLWTTRTSPQRINLADADQAEPHFVAEVAGTYSFELVVESRAGRSDPDTVVVTVGSESIGLCASAPGALPWLGLIASATLLLRRKPKHL